MKQFAAALAALLGLAACTGANPAAVAPAAVSRAPVRPAAGVIVSARPVAAARAGGVEGSILGAVGAPAAGGAGAAACEFIVREDDGRTLSVVQAPAAGLQPGRRVVVSAGVRTRLMPAAD